MEIVKNVMNINAFSTILLRVFIRRRSIKGSLKVIFSLILKTIRILKKFSMSRHSLAFAAAAFIKKKFR